MSDFLNDWFKDRKFFAALLCVIIGVFLRWLLAQVQPGGQQMNQNTFSWVVYGAFVLMIVLQWIIAQHQYLAIKAELKVAKEGGDKLPGLHLQVETLTRQLGEASGNLNLVQKSAREEKSQFEASLKRNKALIEQQQEEIKRLKKFIDDHGLLQ